MKLGKLEFLTSFVRCDNPDSGGTDNRLEHNVPKYNYEFLLGIQILKCGHWHMPEIPMDRLRKKLSVKEQLTMLHNLLPRRKNKPQILPYVLWLECNRFKEGITASEDVLVQHYKKYKKECDYNSGHWGLGFSDWEEIWTAKEKIEKEINSPV